jgi:serine/threonine protein kinase
LFYYVLQERKRKTKKLNPKDSASTSRIDELTMEIVTSNLRNEAIHKFCFDELIVATDNYKSRNIVGQGGFGKVYRGKLVPTNQVCKIKYIEIKHFSYCFECDLAFVNVLHIYAIFEESNSSSID